MILDSVLCILFHKVSGMARMTVLYLALKLCSEFAHGTRWYHLWVYRHGNSGSLQTAVGWSDARSLLWPGHDAADNASLLPSGLATSTDCLCRPYSALLSLLVVSSHAVDDDDDNEDIDMCRKKLCLNIGWYINEMYSLKVHLQVLQPPIEQTIVLSMGRTKLYLNIGWYIMRCIH